ncbi:MAG: ATP-binding protein, partial [Oscillospiraceae bacterium]|nr:ATP-binding protein [Oscillospiraceae bacterium]
MNLVAENMNHSDKNDVFLQERRSKIIAALNEAIEIFTGFDKKTFNEIISDGLLPVSKAVGFDHVAVYSLKNTEKGKRLGQIYLWHKDINQVVSTTESLAFLPDIKVVHEWVSILKTNECVFRRTESMTEDERSFMGLFGVRSILLVPIFTYGEFWGSITFQDHDKGLDFTEGCLDLLSAAARMCANTIIRNEATKAANDSFESLKHREKIISVLNQTAVTFLSWNERTFEEMMNQSTALIAEAAELDRVSVFRNFKGEHGLHTSQIYRWEKESGGATKPNEIFKDVPYAKITPNWEVSFANRNVINSPVSLMNEPEKGLMTKAGAISIFAAPIFFGDSFWGVVLYEDNRSERYFDEDCAEMLRSTAFFYGNAVMRTEMELDILGTNELMYESLKQQEFLNDISRKIISSGASDELIRESIEQLGNFLEVSRVCIYAVDYENKDVTLAYCWYSDGVPAPCNNFTGLIDFLNLDFKEAQDENDITYYTVFCNDVNNAPEFKNFIEESVKSFVGSPIYSEGRLWGVLNADQCDKNREWTEREVSFVETATTVIAGTIMRSIYNKKLNQAVKSATEASSAKGIFLSNMSHEMRTPLNTISGMASIGLNSSDTERKNYALEKIEEASEHLSGVINDVLDMSKIEANKLELVWTDFSFEKMLKKTVNAICFRCEQKRQKFNVSVDGRIPHILIGDDQRLAQVIINLLSNAVKFTPEEGSIKLSAELSEEKDSECTILIEVKDTGIGVKPEQQEKLFKSFEQAESGTSRKFGGTGLGLAVSKRIVELMGGEIGLVSEYGKGSTFKFSFKAKRGKENNIPLLDPSV